jgi:hypothetical protein
MSSLRSWSKTAPKPTSLVSTVNLYYFPEALCCHLTYLSFLSPRLTVDTSDVGFGAVLLQERKDDIDLPNCYFS